MAVMVKSMYNCLFFSHHHWSFTGALQLCNWLDLKNVNDMSGFAITAIAIGLWNDCSI
jgi:hypothetical protein